ncbi:putative Methyltransferase type 11 [Candidatus Competibacter denitrificans Run_A_D11]|uniref:Methyltransferase type 11 n=1 Tax=Candidatus Competibacter denitrificans Run_A_D11 TaxID=1400863 RepID=W6M9D2_9GAMM|nr:class I SAM-dependent methyltransferase [Candidatus Competibacter denitrificans]CDI04601.1 putative Methyltransferase type 11 [Candidatus Competibacter denitrificans Run_A_D11]
MPDLALLYDDLAETYAAGRHLFDTTPVLEEFARFLPPGVRVLDAGCGAGEPVARYFVERGDTVTGIDLSERMLALARRQVPEATFQRMDVRALEFPPASFDGIAAVYVVFHLPRAEHAALFSGFARVLTPGGALLLTLATREYTGQDEFDGEREFLGRRRPYSHDRPEVGLGKLQAAGLAVVSARLIDTGGETFYWVIARKPVEQKGIPPDHDTL